MIFSNWLLMYLNDFELQALMEKCLRSMKTDGFLFFRESCFHASGNIKKVDKNENPTQYRSPTQYIDIVLTKVLEINGENYGFELIFARPNRTYIEVKAFVTFNVLNLAPFIRFFLCLSR
jgi:phosphoethanolamine N-methyltransferase